jgi:hypothetical protein
MQNKPSTKRISSVALILPGVLFLVVRSVPDRVPPMTNCRRQWTRLVSERRARPALERRRPGLLKNIKGFNFEVVRMGRIITKG